MDLKKIPEWVFKISTLDPNDKSPSSILLLSPFIDQSDNKIESLKEILNKKFDAIYHSPQLSKNNIGNESNTDKSSEMGTLIDNDIKIDNTSNNENEINGINTLTVDPDGDKFVCPECGKEYSRVRFFKLHMEKDHNYSIIINKSNDI